MGILEKKVDLFDGQKRFVLSEAVVQYIQDLMDYADLCVQHAAAQQLQHVPTVHHHSFCYSG